MKVTKAWMVLGSAVLALGAGGCSGGDSPSANSTKRPNAASSALTTQTGPTPQDPAATPQGGSVTPPSLPADVTNPAQFVQQLMEQVQKAASTPNGPKPISPAEAQAIVDEMNAKFGIPVPKR